MRTDPFIGWLCRGGTAFLVALATSCTPRGQCDGRDFFIYTANGSSPELFHEDRGRALFFAYPPDAGGVFYQYDGARLTELASLPEEPLAWVSFRGSPVVLTRDGLWRLTDADRFEVLKRFEAPLPDAPCSPKNELLVEFGDRLIFIGPDGAGRAQLWAYRPASDTIEVIEIPRRYPGAGPCSDMTEATVIGDRMVFTARTQGYRPWGMPDLSWWSYDGRDLVELLPGPYEGYDAQHVLWQGLLWLRAFTFSRMVDGGVLNDTTVGHAIAVYDGGPEPPQVVSSLDLSPVAAVGDTLVLLHEQPRQLWTYDARGFTVAVPDLEWCGSPARFAAGDGQLYFTCYIDQSYASRGLVAFDASLRRVDILVRQGVDRLHDSVSGLLAWNGLLLYAGEDEREAITSTARPFTGTGTEPWVYVIASGVATRIEDLSPGYTLRCDDL